MIKAKKGWELPSFFQAQARYIGHPRPDPRINVDGSGQPQKPSPQLT